MVKQDMSAYWIPQLYHRNKNGTFTSVKSQGATIYYLQRGDKEDGPITAFPDGFRMIAGDMNLRTYKNTLEQRAITYVCLGVSGPQTSAFPKQNCPAGMRAQINFPFCWDGKRVDSPDHKSHVAYASLVDNGKCPKTHPVRLVHLFYEVVFDTNAYKDEYVNGATPDFRWSMNDPTGYGLHGDFLNGWHRPTLQKAIDTCTADSGVIEECKAFQLFTGDQMRTCKLERPLGLNEVVTGTIPKLIMGGAAAAPKPTAPKPTVTKPIVTVPKPTGGVKVPTKTTVKVPTKTTVKIPSKTTTRKRVVVTVTVRA
ncbi:hypothetical protein HK104_011265 [Borealophlyctis nickersoniae]|nr:hypothetical protein HK104_011265 [Borealophlyctis nickersoniae]